MSESQEKLVTPNSSLITDVEVQRYARQILLPQVGGAGQKRLRAARVLCVGVGGLGSAAALYLAAAGVGTLGLLDDDPVETSNLHRQVLHFTDDVGRPKVTSGKNTLVQLNPHVSVNVHRLRLDAANAADLVGAYDLVVDGSDNFPTRYIVNDACVLRGVPLVSGAVVQWQGQVTTVLPREGHCYRCLFPEPPAEGAAQSCSEAGIMGSAAGVVGCLQATEAIKVILKMPGVLKDRLLTMDFATMKFREVAARRDPKCAVCGEKPTITAPQGGAAPVCRDAKAGG